MKNLRLVENLARYALQRRFLDTWQSISNPSNQCDLSSFFERICVINLDRRPDRWTVVSDRLARSRVIAKRYPAVDANSASVATDYEQYTSNTRHGADPLPSKDAYRSDEHARRVATLQRDWGQPAIKTVGGYAYLCSWLTILEDACRDRVRSLLVLDDDVAFHKNLSHHFANVLCYMPCDWAVLQLGTLRRRGLKRLKWWSPYLFMNEGMSIGSHAVGLAGKVLPELRELVERRDAVLDDGALSTLTWRHRRRSFVTFPELVIQDLRSSDIMPDALVDDTERLKAARRYRWRLEEYDL